MVAVGGSQPAGESWPTVVGPAGQGDTAADKLPFEQPNQGVIPGFSGEKMALSEGASASGRRSPFGPVLHFVDPKDAHGGGTAQRLADALQRRPGESGESHLARAVQTLRDILSAGDLSDGEKGNLLSQAVDTMMGAGMTLKAEAQALIAKAKSERDRLDALLATVKS